MKVTVVDLEPVVWRRLRVPDSGGPYGYAELLAALRNRAHPEHESYHEWAAPRLAPDAFDAARINRYLRGVRG